MDNIPGKKFVKKAEETGNEVEVPMARNLGMVMAAWTIVSMSA